VLFEMRVGLVASAGHQRRQPVCPDGEKVVERTSRLAAQLETKSDLGNHRYDGEGFRNRLRGRLKTGQQGARNIDWMGFAQGDQRCLFESVKVLQKA
jgi:hypothetical protein